MQIIGYVHGVDNTDDLALRPRTVAFGTDNNVWKLGDVVNSTQDLGGSLEQYDTLNSDATYRSFVDNNAYKNSGLVFAGPGRRMLTPSGSEIST